MKHISLKFHEIKLCKNSWICIIYFMRKILPIKALWLLHALSILIQKKLRLLARCILCFAWISDQTSVIFLQYLWIFVTVTIYVLLLRSEFSNSIWMNFEPQGVNLVKPGRFVSNSYNSICLMYLEKQNSLLYIWKKKNRKELQNASDAIIKISLNKF
jgi:hypothetical protein